MNPRILPSPGSHTGGTGVHAGSASALPTHLYARSANAGASTYAGSHTLAHTFTLCDQPERTKPEDQENSNNWMPHIASSIQAEIDEAAGI